MLKILLVGNYLPDRQHSMLGFTGLMEQGLKNAGHDVHTLYPPVVFGKVGQRIPAAGKWLGYIDKLALLPPLLNKAVHEADIVHICDHSNAVYVPAKRQTPFVVTCHDLLAVRGGLGEQTDCPATPMGSLLQRWILRGLARADGLACDSTATLNDAIRLLPPRQQPTELLPIALKYDYHPLSEEQSQQELRKISGLDLSKPFILHVGSSLRRKNREGILRTFAKVGDKTNVQLVFAGRPLEASKDSWQINSACMIEFWKLEKFQANCWSRFIVMRLPSFFLHGLRDLVGQLLKRSIADVRLFAARAGHFLKSLGMAHLCAT